jgi:hypothetical protein
MKIGRGRRINKAKRTDAEPPAYFSAAIPAPEAKPDASNLVRQSKQPNQTQKIFPGSLSGRLTHFSHHDRLETMIVNSDATDISRQNLTQAIPPGAKRKEERTVMKEESLQTQIFTFLIPLSSFIINLKRQPAPKA